MQKHKVVIIRQAIENELEDMFNDPRINVIEISFSTSGDKFTTNQAVLVVFTEEE